MARWTKVAVALVSVCLVAAGCSSGSEPAPKKFEPASLKAAKAAALDAAGGKEIGGRVNLMGVLGGGELDDFLEVIKPFEEATGVDVKYEGTRDFGAVLQTRVKGGNPPELAVAPAIGLLAGLAREGKTVDLVEVLGQDFLDANFDPSLVKTGSVDGQVFGLLNNVNLGGLIFFDPKKYKGPTDAASWDDLQAWAAKEAKSGTTPWCVSLESGPASGWPGADFIDDILLRQAGPEFHAKWAAGQVPWTAPEVKKAFETWGGIVNRPGFTYGDKNTILSTNFENGADPMYAPKPKCFLHQQATFMGGIIASNFPELKPGKDIDFFPAPDFNPEFPKVQSISGEVATMFEKTPQSVALVKYLSSKEAGVLIAETGRWLSPNKQVPQSEYTDPFLAKASTILQEAKGSYTLGNSLMPQNVVDAFWKSALDYVKDPGDLDAILAEVEKARLSSQ